MSKPRLFIPILTHFSIRYLLRTGMIQKFKEFSDPIVGMSWQDADLDRDFKELGIPVVQVPAFTFSREFQKSRSQVYDWHMIARKTATMAIDRRREASLMGRREALSALYHHTLNDLSICLPGNVEKLLKLNEELFWSDTNVIDFEQILQTTQPDAIFSITPYVNREEPLLRAAARAKIRCATSILSFDNITTRAPIPIKFDKYMVWNHYNYRELLRAYPAVKTSDVVVTGPPQFDFYQDPSYIVDETDWRKSLNLPADKLVILFGGGTYQVVPHEPFWLKQLDEEISAGNIPGNPVILFRRHPGDIASRWEEILANAKNVVIDQSWKANEKRGQVNITRADIENLISTLVHCAVHINASSTLTVDGAIFDRPQIGPAYDADPEKKFDRVLKDLYIREHYLPITRSGGLDVVYSREQLRDAVRTAIETPAARAEGRKKIVEEICVYSDGKCSDRVVDAMRDWLS